MRGEAEESVRLISDPNAAHYRLALGKILPQELRAARVGGDSDSHLLYMPPGSHEPGPAELERIAEQEAEEFGGRAFSRELLSMECEANKVLKGSWDGEGTLPSYARSFAEPLISKVSKDQMREVLEKLTAHESRNVAATSYPDAVHFVGSKMQEAGLEMVQDYAAPSGGHGDFERESVHHGPCQAGMASCWKQHNLVGQIVGSNPKLHPMLVAAHMDDLPSSGRAPGAEDNGSGVAVMLELARVFADYHRQSAAQPALERNGAPAWPERTILFAAFGGEEAGLVGSEHFASVHASRDRKLDGAFIMDEVGWSARDGPGVQFETYDRPDTRKVVDLMGRSAKAFGQFSRLDQAFQPYGSDHMSLLQRPEMASGVVLAINTDDREYAHYHKKTDTIDNIDFGLMESMARTIGSAAALHASPSRAAPPAVKSSASKPMVEELEKRPRAEARQDALIEEWIAALQPRGS